MKKLNRFLAVLLACCMISTLFVCVASAESDVIYRVNFKDKTASDYFSTLPSGWEVNSYGTAAVTTSYDDTGLHFYGNKNQASNTNKATLSIPVIYQNGTTIASLCGPIYRETNSSHATWHKLVFISIGGVEYPVNSTTYLTMNDTQDKERVSVEIDTVDNKVTATVYVNDTTSYSTTQALRTAGASTNPEVKIILKMRYANAQRYVISSYTVTNTPAEPAELDLGEVLFDEDFDNVETATDAGMTASPAADVTVVADPLGRDGKALMLSRSSADSITADIEYGATSGQYLLEYDIYDNYFEGQSIVQLGGSSAQFKIFENDTKTITYCNLGTYNNGEQLPLSPTTWNRIALLYDLDADKMHMYKNGMYITTKDVTLNSITHFRFRLYGTNAGGKVYFDNIKLTKLPSFRVVGLTLSSQSSKDGTYTSDLNKGALRGTVGAVKTALNNGDCTYAVLSAFNGKYTNTKVVYIAAAYSDGRLVDTMSGVYGLAPNSSKSQSFCICDILTDDVDEIKLYVWDSLETMVPVTHSVTINNDGIGDSSSGSDGTTEGGGSDDSGEDPEEDTES